METRLKVVLLATVSILTVIGLGAMAYAQTNGTSSTGRCGSMMGSRGMGSMGETNRMGMMEQSSCTQASCQTMMGQPDMAQCQSMVSQNLGQCQEIVRQQNTTQACQ